MPRKKAVEIDLETCTSCRFFIMDDPKDDAGYCRRFPPVYVSSEDGASIAYPVVVPADWCGEYKRRTQ